MYNLYDRIFKLPFLKAHTYDLSFGDILSPLYANLLLCTLTWVYSSFKQDITSVDYLWGLSFVIQTGFYYFKSLHVGHFHLEKLTFSVLVMVHSLRLTAYLIIRNLNKPEDQRYAWIRSKIGRNFWWLSYFLIFLPQLVVSMIVGMVIYAFNKSPLTSLNQMLYWNGIVVMISGSLFQSLADIQLYNFKNKKSNIGKIMDKELWSMCRHPNYFGDTIFWWGAYACNISTNIYHTFFAPLTFTICVYFITGVPVLERFMRENHGHLYTEYSKRVSRFIPWVFNKPLANKSRKLSEQAENLELKNKNIPSWKKAQIKRTKSNKKNQPQIHDVNRTSNEFYKVMQH